MAGKIIQALVIGGQRFELKSCWEELGLTKDYMLALLGRDEYTPVATKQPTGSDVLYTDPGSGGVAGVHAGQCVVYPDAEVADGWGLSIAKRVTVGEDGTPTSAVWYHATDVEKRVAELEEKLVTLHYGCYGTGVWINDYPWHDDAVWEN